jgi:hypothetical protein
MHFLVYALHYVILRTLYDGARAAGVPAWVMVACAVVGLVLLYGTRHRVRRRVAPPRVRRRRGDVYREAYERERGRRDAVRERLP